MKSIIFIKLGGSVITDKKIPYKADTENIRRFAKELKAYKGGMVLAHGSGSFAHVSASKYGGKKGYKSLKGIAKVARDAMDINRIVMDILVEEGLPVISFRANSLMIALNGKLNKDLFDAAELALSQGLIPVFYGDVIWDKKWNSTIFSGEKILDYFCKYLLKKKYKIEKIIQASNTNGIYDNNGNTIPIITKQNFVKIKKYVFNSENVDVTGGMLHKVINAMGVLDFGISTNIINGNVKGELKKAINGKITGGTLIK